jgi:hypothetical protein
MISESNGRRLQYFVMGSKGFLKTEVGCVFSPDSIVQVRILLWRIYLTGVRS